MILITSENSGICKKILIDLNEVACITCVLQGLNGRVNYKTEVLFKNGKVKEMNFGKKVFDELIVKGLGGVTGIYEE